MVNFLDLIVGNPPCGVDRLRLGEPLWEDSRGLSYRLPIVSPIVLLNSGYTSAAFIKQVHNNCFYNIEVLFETLNREGKVLKKALR